MGEIATSAELQKHWGEPDKIIPDEGTEEWIYKHQDWRWYGIILYAVVVPLPLALPLGAEYEALTIKDGQIEAATKVRSSVVASGYCGFFVMIYPNGLGCGAGSYEKE